MTPDTYKKLVEWNAIERKQIGGVTLTRLNAHGLWIKRVMRPQREPCATCKHFVRDPHETVGELNKFGRCHNPRVIGEQSPISRVESERCSRHSINEKEKA